jgi:2,4-dienoyl-CoA reductase-like NADH-dependent reductase (Old Yellow Enzyme family)
MSEERSGRSSALDALFAPLTVRSMTLANRIAMAPMTRSASPGGIPGPDMRGWYRRRAENGVGLITTEGVRIQHFGSNYDSNVPCFYGEEALAEWDLIRRDVQAAGCRIMPQLWHVGLMLNAAPTEDRRDASDLGQRQCGPSGMAGGMNIKIEKLADPMSVEDIENVIDAYGQAAQAAYRLGFDGVSLHGAHGYLIDQFFWDKTNLRDDRYGGTLEKRSRFAADVVREIRRRTAPEFPISLRFSQWKGHDFTAKLAANPRELERMLRPIIDAGVDMFDCSLRRFWEPEFEGSDLNLAGWTKKVTGLPTMAVGSISLDSEMMPGQVEHSQPTSIDRVLEMLERGDFDLVVVGRALIANPDWPRIVKAQAYDCLKPYDSALLDKVY